MVLAPLVVEKPPYDPVQDFVPRLGRIARVPGWWSRSTPGCRLSSFPELLGLARANRGTLTLCLGVLGTQVAVDLLMDSAGVKVRTTCLHGGICAGNTGCCRGSCRPHLSPTHALLAPTPSPGLYGYSPRPVPRADARPRTRRTVAELRGAQAGACHFVERGSGAERYAGAGSWRPLRWRPPCR